MNKVNSVLGELPVPLRCDSNPVALDLAIERRSAPVGPAPVGPLSVLNYSSPALGRIALADNVPPLGLATAPFDYSTSHGGHEDKNCALDFFCAFDSAGEGH
eukprot:6796203-Prymnesium_polylepis.1